MGAVSRTRWDRLQLVADRKLIHRRSKQRAHTTQQRRPVSITRAHTHTALPARNARERTSTTMRAAPHDMYYIISALEPHTRTHSRMFSEESFELAQVRCSRACLAFMNDVNSTRNFGESNTTTRCGRDDDDDDECDDNDCESERARREGRAEGAVYCGVVVGISSAPQGWVGLCLCCVGGSCGFDLVGVDGACSCCWLCGHPDRC